MNRGKEGGTGEKRCLKIPSPYFLLFRRFIPFVFLVVLFSGCAGLVFRQADVTFEDSAIRLGIQSAEPTPEELAGVEIFDKPDFQKPLRYREENVVYAQIQNGRGIQMKLDLVRTDTFKPVKQKDAALVVSETKIAQGGGQFFEEKEVTDKGEILKFIRGFHHAQYGKFEITDWKRTPYLPAGKSKIGEAWTSEESMNLKIKSFWIKPLQSTPYITKSQNRLEGFALVRGVRCAVVKTTAEQTKEEHFKAFFKEFHFRIRAKIRETSYWDYQAGRLMAKVTRITSTTQGINIPLNDFGESQSLVSLEMSS